MMPVALTIAGSDPSGGAGIQADLKTFHQFRVYGEAAITLLTAQNTVGVTRVHLIDAEVVREQVEAVLADIRPHAAKTGALGGLEQVEMVAEMAAEFDFPLVVDPVMVSKHGARLLSPDAETALRNELLPHAALVTPNISETERLAGLSIKSLADMEQAARCIAGLGPKAVLIKGGHLAGEPVDLLFDGREMHRFRGQRVETRHTHGTGCTYSAAITALLAQEISLRSAVGRAKAFIQAALETAPGLGQGTGPVNHFASVTEWVRA
jgi:hydroxymethylpyrimidine/phosphomethylpyrimidine kinase